MKKDRVYTFLHVFDDDKFFDAVTTFFDSLNNVRNLYFYYSPNRSFKFNHIKQSNKIRLFTNFNEYVSWFSKPEVDAIYFQGICDRNNLKLVNYIGDKQKVFWWSFGAELYNVDGLSPIVRLPLLKPKTQQSYNRFRIFNLRQIIKRIYFLVVSPYYLRLRDRFIKRVDYYTPVLSIEYDILKEKLKNFRARPFMLNCGPTTLREFPFCIKEIPGHVMVGNSLTYSNNYLDVLDILKKITLPYERKYVFPISYGQDYGGRERFKQQVKINNNKLIWLEGFVPYEQYRSIFDNITHAVFGFIRQQGIGNVDLCLRTGVKVYLYSDSVVYKHYKQKGYKIFTIENDLTIDSLCSCLSKEDAYHNYTLLLDRYKCSYIENVENEIDELFQN